MQFQENDMLYLFTDGYADQFGGMLGKKLMTKNLKDVLVSIHGLSMKKQGEFLEHYLEKWKEKFEQADDILVIGLKYI